MIKRKKVLICFSEIPYPVRRNGISIRYLPILERFNKEYEIDLLLILDEPADKDHLEALESYCENLYCYVQNKSRPNILKRLFVNLRALLPGQQPLEVYSYDNRKIKSYVVSKTRGIHYDVKLSVVIAYAELIRDCVSADRYVIDCIDSRYAHAVRVSNNTLMDRYKLSLLRRWEINCISKADMVSFVSAMDVGILTEGGPEIKNIEVIPNGIYIDDYTDDKESVEGFVIGFLGNMDYHPNIHAALKLSDIFNNLKKEISDLKLLIIGRNPGQDILDLQKMPGVIVTGSVESIWPYVNATDVFVFPMSHGAGQQNKLLDVMYAGRPVISSGLGNSGIGAKEEQEIEIADTDDEIKAKIVALYKDAVRKKSLAMKGKEFIEKKYGWDSIFKKIESDYFSNS